MALQGVPVGQIPQPPSEYDEADEGAFRDAVRQWMEEANAWMQQRSDVTDTVSGFTFMPATTRWFRPGQPNDDSLISAGAVTEDLLYLVPFVTCGTNGHADRTGAGGHDRCGQQHHAYRAVRQHRPAVA